MLFTQYNYNSFFFFAITQTVNYDIYLLYFSILIFNSYYYLHTSILVIYLFIFGFTTLWLYDY